MLWDFDFVPFHCTADGSLAEANKAQVACQVI